MEVSKNDESDIVCGLVDRRSGRVCFDRGKLRKGVYASERRLMWGMGDRGRSGLGDRRGWKLIGGQVDSKAVVGRTSEIGVE